MINKKLLYRMIYFVIVILSLPLFSANAVTIKEQDITFRCKIKMQGTKESISKAFDRQYSTRWGIGRSKTSLISIDLPNDIEQGGLYLCFAIEPRQIEVFHGDDQESFYREEGDGFAHRYIPFCGDTKLRLEISSQDQLACLLSELFVTSGKEPPDWVQIWQARLEKADMLILVAHPDDELLWMGGAIPYYKVHRDFDVAVAYLTCANSLRRSEMLNGLWTAGVRHYPYVAGFRDRREASLKKSYEIWGGASKVEDYITGLYRKLKPQVVLSHDLFGEYGHPAHIICAKETVNALTSAADEKIFPDSAMLYGSWDVPKLYLHLYGENRIVMDWEKPLSAFGGKTSLDVTKEAFNMHKSQKSKFKVSDKGVYSCSHFGLVRSLVGDDVDKDDFFENILPLSNFIAND